MRKNRIGLSLITLSVILLMGVVSCKKYYDPPPVFEKYGRDSVELQRKVLIISIDGASGRAIKEINPPNIARLMEHGKYSYNQPALPVSTDASTWVTMLTGMSYDKHQIKDSTFQFTFEGGLDHENEDMDIPNYPPVFNYILPIKPKLKIAAITPWQNLSDYLGLLDYSIAVPNDQAVADTAISLLKSVNPLGIMVVDLNEADIAGQEGEPSIADFDYRNAIIDADKKVGDIIQGLQSRKNFDNEDWLIMVTSNRGGTVENPEPGFIVVNNPRLEKEEVKATGFNTIHFTGSGDDAITATVPDDGGLYNFGDDKDFTVQMQVKFDGGVSWPGFFSKSTGLSGGSITGWVIALSGDVYVLFDGGTDNGTPGKQQTNTDIPVANDSRWHTITVSFKSEDGKRNARLYVDGELNKTVDVGSRNFDTDEPLRIGKVSGDNQNYAEFYAADVEIFNKALPSDTIKKYKDLQDITQHPAYDDLIGYWPLDDGAGSYLKNQAPTGFDMQLHGAYEWIGLGDDVPASKQAESSPRPSVTPELVDINANLFYWLEIEKRNDWELEGTPWLDNYEDELYDL